MLLILELTITVLLASLLYFYFFKIQKNRKTLDWLPLRNGYPIVGNSFEFLGGSTEYLNTLSKIIKEEGKIAHLEITLRPIIVTTDYKLIESVLSSNSLNILDKANEYKFFSKWLGTGLLTAGGIKWKGRRRILTPAFHFQILEQFVEVFQSASDILVKKLNNEVGKTSVDIYQYVTLCALDIICETAMGVKINAQDNTNSEYVRSVKEMCRILVERTFSPIEMFDIFYQFCANYKTEKRCLKVLHDYTNNVIRNRRKLLQNKFINHNNSDVEDTGIKKRKAFLDLLLEVRVDGKPLPDEDIREEVDTFMFEGHDTTASGMSFALYSLANNPECQEKAVQELKEIFGSDVNKPITYRDLQDMKYLEMVVKESLRQYPSVPFFGRNTSEDLEFDGKIIPKGTTIAIYTYGVGMDPDNFEDPHKFNPDRFTSIDGKSPYSYVPFSAGPRNCIGQKFAMLEMKSTIAKVLRNFELVPASPKHEIKLAAETVLKSATGMKVGLKKRDWAKV